MKYKKIYVRLEKKLIEAKKVLMKGKFRDERARMVEEVSHL